MSESQATTDDRYAHYRRTFDDSPVGLLRLSLDGRIMDANQRVLDLLEYEWPELRGKSFRDITHPDDRWIGLEVLLDMGAGRVDNVAYEKRFLTHAGRAICAAITASAISVEGERVGVLVMASECPIEPAIAPIQDSQLDLLKSALSIAPIIVFACDSEGLLILCEDRGLNSPLSTGDFLGRPAWDVYGDTEVVRAQVQRGLAGESGEFVLHFGDADFICRYRPIQALDGTVIGVSGLAQDMTALAKMRVENNRLSEFMATLSHELRNPLNAILGFTELLVNGAYGPLSDRQKRPLAHVEVGGRQLLSLINDILDLAKVKAGYLQLDVEPLDAGEVIRAVADEMSAAAESRDIRLVEMPGPTVTFSADRRRVHQVLLNLLSNAVKFTPAGGRVELACDIERASGGTGEGARMCVSDTGSGLTTEQLKLIFDEFRQVAAHRALNPDGVGLGLPLSRKLATLMGGTLTAESSVGVGSRFCLTLPRQPAAAI